MVQFSNSKTVRIRKEQKDIGSFTSNLSLARGFHSKHFKHREVEIIVRMGVPSSKNIQN
jgi:hypothetical protein